MDQLPVMTSDERQLETRSTECSEALQKWLALFSEHFRQPVSELSALAYARGLADLTREQLDLACEKCLKVCRFMPTVAEVRAWIDHLESETEDAWQGLLDSISKDFVPDIGKAPHLAPAVEHAARAAGGLHYLESCPQSELVWAKKRFIEDFLRIHKTGQAEHLLEAKRILDELATPAERSRLPAPQDSEPQANRPEPSEEEVLAGFAVLRKKRDVRPAHPAPSKEQWERRRAEQLERLRITHPDLDLGKRSRRRRRLCSQCGSTGLVSDGVSGRLCPCEAWRRWAPPRVEIQVSTLAERETRRSGSSARDAGMTVCSLAPSQESLRRTMVQVFDSRALTWRRHKIAY